MAQGVLLFLCPNCLELNCTLCWIMICFCILCSICPNSLVN
jgi:hypothetical protein